MKQLESRASPPSTESQYIKPIHIPKSTIQLSLDIDFQIISTPSCSHIKSTMFNPHCPCYPNPCQTNTEEMKIHSYFISETSSPNKISLTHSIVIPIILTNKSFTVPNKQEIIFTIPANEQAIIITIELSWKASGTQGSMTIHTIS